MQHVAKMIKKRIMQLGVGAQTGMGGCVRRRRLPADEAMAAAAAFSVSAVLFCTGVISPPLSMKNKRFFALQGKDDT